MLPVWVKEKSDNLARYPKGEGDTWIFFSCCFPDVNLLLRAFDVLMMKILNIIRLAGVRFGV